MSVSNESFFAIQQSESVQFLQNDLNFTDLFFDGYHKKAISIQKENGVLSVVVHNSSSVVQKFKLAYPESEPVLSVKLSFDEKFLAIQQSQSVVCFYSVNVNNNDASSAGGGELVCLQSCKGRNTKVVGIEWTSLNEIFFITNHGLELYQIIPEKLSVRSLKVHNISLNWFVYSHATQLLIVSCGTLGNLLHPFMLKFEVELASNPQPPRLVLLDRDLTIAPIYETLSVLVLRHNPRPTNSGAEVLVYQINKESTNQAARKTHVLKLGGTDRFALHVIDNLVLVHQQGGKTSLVFDLGCVSPQPSDDGAENHYPLFTPSPLKLVKCDSLTLPLSVELYGPTWVTFQPNIVVDASCGHVLLVKPHIEAAISLIPHKVDLITFLLRRSMSKSLILDICRQSIAGQQLSFAELARIFDLLNCIVKSTSTTETNPSLAALIAKKLVPSIYSTTVEQHELYSEIFFRLQDYENMDHDYLSKVVIELLLSFRTHNIPIQYCFHELLVNCLLRANKFQMLHQLVQYHVVEDSKPLAFLILSKEGQYPPCLQMAVDMLSRLKTNTNEEIVEILLSKSLILQALRFAQSNGLVNSVNPMKFIEAASNCSDQLVFYTTFKYFEQRSLKTKGTVHFARGDQYDKCLEQYKKLLSVTASSIIEEKLETTTLTES